MNFKIKSFYRKTSGFTLLELMAVISIIAILVAISLPAMKGLTSVPARQSAISFLKGIIEQARIAAMQNGVNTYLYFADDSIALRDSAAEDASAVNDTQFRAVILMRDPTNVETMLADRAGTTASKKALGRWIYLPKGFSFSRAGLLSSGNTEQAKVPSSTIIPRFSATNQTLPALVFSSEGTLITPLSSSHSQFNLIQGVYTEGSTLPMITSKGRDNQTLVDTFSVSRFTGRATVRSQRKDVDDINEL